MAAIATFCVWAKHLQVHSITKAINEEVQDPKSHGRLGQNSHYGLHQLAMTILHGNQEAMDRLETPQSWTACMGLQPQPWRLASTAMKACKNSYESLHSSSHCQA